MSRSWGLWKLERTKLGIWLGTWDSLGVHGRVYYVVEAGRTCTMVLLGPEIQRNAAPHMPDNELIIFAATSPSFRIDGLTVFTDYRLVIGQQIKVGERGLSVTNEEEVYMVHPPQLNTTLFRLCSLLSVCTACRIEVCDL